MTNLIPFRFENSNIRVVVVDDAPWFVGKDVAAALGYADEAQAIKDNCKHSKSLKDIASVRKTEGLPGNAKMIQEPDVYRLIMKSRLPSAEKFEAWVFEEVLPSIHKTGGYDLNSDGLELEKPLSTISKDFAAANDLAKLFGFQGNQALLSANRAIKQIHAIDCAALVGATHLLADSQAVLLTVTEVGQRTGIPRNQVNPILERIGLQKGYRDHRNKQHWELTSQGQRYGIYQDTGKKHSDGTPVRQIKWNAELIEKLKEALDRTPTMGVQ